jgi:uncharacterized protein (DUF58 family)
VVGPLSPGEDRLLDRRVVALKRGEFELDAIRLRGGDPAGLFLREKVFRIPRRILIVPGSEPIPDLRLRPEHAIAATTGQPVSAAGTSQEFYGVREYNAADGMRHIHWKASARFGKLMVREFERNAVMSVAVLLDASERFVSGPEHWSNLEYLVRAAASICTHVATLYCEFAFGAGGSRGILIPPKLAATAEAEVLYDLATLRPGNVSIVDVAYELGDRLPRNTVVFCLSLAATAQLGEALHVLNQQGMTVHWLCAPRQAFREEGSKAQAKRARGRTAELPVPVANLTPGMRLRQVLSFSL